MYPITPADLDWLVEMRSSGRGKPLSGWAGKAKPRITGQTPPILSRMLRTIWFGFSIMEMKATGERVGTSGLQPLEDTGEIEVGYNLSEKYWRQGLGYECAMGWLDYGFNKADLKRIVPLRIRTIPGPGG